MSTEPVSPAVLDALRRGGLEAEADALALGTVPCSTMLPKRAGVVRVRHATGPMEGKPGMQVCEVIRKGSRAEVVYPPNPRRRGRLQDKTVGLEPRVWVALAAAGLGTESAAIRHILAEWLARRAANREPE